ncbi:MAG TPA: hypothetical protein VFE62_04980 [Gemmataceae bacterium]|nr:hypothetical protein [Gemmataceae bacterium]
MRSFPRFCCVAIVLAFLATTVFGQPAPVERKVAAPTRLDWQFAARGVGGKVAPLPAGYDSSKQKYQLYVPKGLAKDKAVGLILFISPGDGPQGWKNWQKVCEKEGLLFACPYGAGNAIAPGLRTRIILDVLDDIRRQYKIDPDQTYLTGFSGGGRMACAIGFALPEYFGGVLPICGTNTISGTTYLRHRVEDRLSVAFITGEKDTNRKENEDVMTPWFKEIGVRTKLWVVLKMGHAVPSGDVLAEVYAWAAEDLKRRREDAKARPKLAVTPEEGLSGDEQAKRLVDAAAADIKVAARTWRAIAIFQGVAQRWGTTQAGKQAQAVLKDALENKTILERVSDQGARDEIKSISAQARAMERFGNIPKAIEAWTLLANNYDGTPIGDQALENVRRLKRKGK